MPKVSVIIPCYNQGKYLEESVNSVLNQTFQDFEIIIVNDGSTDNSKEIIDKIEHPKVIKIHQENKGVAAARNEGIKRASGEYILPLDSDDKIAPTYIEKAVHHIEKDPNIGIVYCEAEFFGEKTKKWNLPSYSLFDMLKANCIFCTALFRKKDWEIVGGYREKQKNLWEDYDFWLSLIEMGREVFQIPEVLFYYRQYEETSRSKETNADLLQRYRDIIDNHPKLYLENIPFLIQNINNFGIKINKIFSIKLSPKYKLRLLLEKQI